MIDRILLIFLFLASLIIGGRNQVGQPCKKLLQGVIKICLARHSYCDENDICRCEPGYPVNISFSSCRKGRKYAEKCEFTEECYYYDPNSYCSQLPYRSTCECHNGFLYNESKKICIKVGGETPKPTNLVFPTAIGLSLAFASIICCCLVLWHVCKRQNIANAVFSRERMPSHTHFLSTHRDSHRSICVPSAPPADEALPTYDTALSQKITEDCGPPPSYEDVICHESTSKT